jgi:L-asparaginase
MIHVLFTGGTISMRRDAAAGGNIPAYGGDALLALAPGIDRVAPLTAEDWARRPACHFTPADLWALRERVRAVAESGAASGIVVTHGTDILEESAYLLARTVATEMPIVLTGAMRTADDPDWDGAANLTDAVRVAAAPESRGRGALVAFAGSIWRGEDAVKIEATALDAFGAPHGTRAGIVNDHAVEFHVGATRRAPLAPRGLDARVTLVALVPGDDGALLDAARASHDGAVVVAFGSGNSPPGIVPAVSRWLDDGKPVVLASRCARGQVTPLYAFDGGGAQLVRMGAIPAGPRTPWQARMELAIALSAGVAYGAEG